MWKATLGDRVLTFDLVGINNQNFIMADRETGSWWQQVTGKAILGPLTGEQLELMPFDQVSFELWSAQHPDSKVLEARDEFAARYWDEAAADETRDGSMMPFVTDADPGDPLEQGELVAVATLPEGPKAYPMKLLREQNPIVDEVRGRPLLVMVAADGRSVRAFERTLDGQTLELFAKPDSDPLRFVDTETGSEWDFGGQAVEGPLAGNRLAPVTVYTDYWFDWKEHYPDEPVYTAGLPAP